MKKITVYMSCLSVLALCGACTEQTDDIPTSEPAPLNIQARTSDTPDGTTWESFPENTKIIVYNAASNLKDVPAAEKGIYFYKKQTDNSLKWINEPSKDYVGLWPDAIQYDSDNGKHFFTATSGNEDGNVSLDQSKGYTDDDFLVARSTISEQRTESYWKKNGITLYFRHVLSKIRVNVYLPIGNEDGYFAAANQINKVTMLLVRPREQYIVTYNNSLEDKQIATVNTKEDKASKNLVMYPVGNQADKVPGTTTETEQGTEAERYTFEAIIPHGQYYPQDEPCLDITVKYNSDNYSFTYAPPGNTIMEFAQEKVTIVNLTLLHTRPTNKVFLNSVKLQNWITDEADMDLIPDDTNKP